MKAWLRQHRFAFRHALQRMPRSGFLLNVLVVAITLALPFAGLTALENILPVSEQLAVQAEISVFLSLDTPRGKADALALQIHRIAQQAHAGGTLEFVSRDDALRKLKSKAGIGDVVTALGSNPLPDAYVLTLAGIDNAADASRINTLAAQLKALPGVDYVQVDSEWIARLAALLHVSRLALGLLAAMLAVVVVAVVFNTVRLQLLDQRDEIEIARLVGATDAFVCRPFYYTGALLGACAGALGLMLVAIMLQPLNQAIADVARLYASSFRLAPLGFGPSAALLTLSAALGLLGALLSARRNLARLS